MLIYKNNYIEYKPNKCIIVDIDGTVADNSHRQHFVRSKPRNWKAFNATIDQDKIIEEVRFVVECIRRAGVDVLFVSAREGSKEIFDTTKEWLNRFFTTNENPYYTALFMRDEKDYRDDSIVKSEILDQLLEEGWDPICVFDDRDRVVEMWRSRGIKTLQVAPGNF